MKPRWALVAAVLAVLVFTDAHATPIGDEWSQVGRDSAHTYSSSGPAPGSTLLWRSDSGGGITEIHAAANGLAFAHRSDAIVALDQKTGVVVRTFPIPAVRTYGVSGGLLIVGTEGGMIRAFDVGTGAVVWSQQTGAAPNVAIDGGRVFVNSGLGDGRLRALDAATGNVLWTADGVGNASSSPTISGGLVFQNTAGGGSIRAFDVTTGAPRWTTSTGTVISSAVANATQLFAGVQSDHFLALSQETGAILWDAPIPGESYAVGVVGDLALAASFTGQLHALDTATGAIAWSFTVGSCCAGVASAGGQLFSSGPDGLFALDQDTGNLLWRYDLAFVPILADGTLFAVNGGEVVALGVPEPATLVLLMLGLAVICVVVSAQHRRAVGSVPSVATRST